MSRHSKVYRQEADMVLVPRNRRSYLWWCTVYAGVERRKKSFVWVRWSWVLVFLVTFSTL